MTQTATTPGSVTEALRQAAAGALREGTVNAILGYGHEPGAGIAAPLFARTPEEAEDLVFDASCMGNLAVYLAKPEVRSLGKLGLVVKGCDLRAVHILIHEHVISRDDIVLIGVCCSGVGDPLLAKCGVCEVHNPENCDLTAGPPVERPPVSREEREQKIRELEAMPIEERWAFWEKQFSKCVRCYACRQVCPLCYCKQCVVEKSRPQWIETSPHLRGNLAWNVVRAFHLTGRCVGCGECERVCPVDIPLGLINTKMALLMEDWFNYRSGFSPDEKTPFTTWSPDDPENGIL